MESFHNLMQLLEHTAESVVLKQGIDMTIPSVLGPLSDRLPILKRIPALRIRNIEKLVQHVEKRLNLVELDFKKIETDEYGYYAYRILEKGLREHRDIKIRMLASVLVHTASKDCNDDFDTQLELLEFVDWMELWHVNILSYLRDNHCDNLPDGNIKTMVKATFDELIKNASQLPRGRENPWMKNALLGLNDRNLIRIIGGGGVYIKSSGERKGYQEYITDRGTMMERAEIGLTQLGIDLLQYIRHASDDLT